MQNIQEMSLIELKKVAKTRRIKQYYIMKRADLINILMMEELPFKYRIEKMTISEMRSIAKQRGMRGFWGLSKEDLCNKLFTAHDEKEDYSKTCKHEDPKNEDTEEIGVKIAEDTIKKGSDDVTL
jgi:hypothetical protein